MERLFTLEEASALLPRLIELLTDLQQQTRELATGTGDAAANAGSGNGSAAAASGASEAERRYLALLLELDGLGVVVRDPGSGLVDFAATRDQEPVYLCWRLGEPTIAHWHPREGGFAGRMSL